ncbi:MAG: hypothetical protein PHF08_02535, partial [Candidatus Riflebacteria bacterium]|nr:hypothetical protein [Candidatus Riflebacteria bacterium]
MKNQTVLCKKGALLAIALFLIVGIAAIVPFLIQSSESAGERAKYSDEWNKIQWAVSGIKNKHIEKGVKSDFYNPYGNSTVATISYGDFHVSVNVSERKTMLDKNSCFSLTPSVYRGSSQPYADGGYDLSDYAVNSNSAPGVAAGAKHSFAWKKDGTLYAWGRNKMGQLGLNDTSDYYSSPQEVKRGNLFTQGGYEYFNQGWLVAGGNETALAVDYSGNAYGWGKLSENSYINSIDLLTGDGIAKIPMSFGASNVLDIACGNGFFALLTSDRKIKYSSWNSKFGKESSLSLLNGLSEINGISGNGDHLLAITSNGDIWGYGSNEKYQLGRNDSSLKGPI